MKQREGLGRVYAVQGNGRPTTEGNPVLPIACEFGAEPALLLDAQERQRRQGALNALKIVGWDKAANDVLHADGYGCDEDLEILINGLRIARDRRERTPAEIARFDTAIREVSAIMGVPS